MPVRPPAIPVARGPVRIELDWDSLEIAVERNSPDTDSYLDLTTGRVLTITAGDPEAAINRQAVSENIRNFLRIEPASSREQYRWMEKFVGSVVDEALRERLIISIDGKGAFRRFKDVLLAYPAERERWFSYRADLLHWHIQNWLESHEIATTNDPPWGTVQAPQELPTAIAFLEFLKQRSTEALAKAAPEPADLDRDPDVDSDHDADRDSDSDSDSDTDSDSDSDTSGP